MKRDRRRLPPRKHSYASGLVAIAPATAMIAAGGCSAWLVYRTLGLKFVSRSWFNLDSVWAVSLVLVGGVGTGAWPDGVAAEGEHGAAGDAVRAYLEPKALIVFRHGRAKSAKRVSVPDVPAIPVFASNARKMWMPGGPSFAQWTTGACHLTLNGKRTSMIRNWIATGAPRRASIGEREGVISLPA
jgi:hypothetical protein